MPSHNIERISIKQMYANPTGKGSANVASRYSIRNGMNATFIKNLNSYRREFLALPYIALDGTIYFWVKVPSRNFKFNKIKYDAIFQIEPGNLPIALRPCKFFVNSPSFIFTYAYVFNQEGLLIDWLKPRLPYLCLTRAPKMRNPVESRGYELILYQALSYLITGGCLSDSYINRFKQNFDGLKQIEMTTKVADPAVLMQMYRYGDYESKKKHKKPLSKTDELAQKKALREFETTNKKNAPIQPKKIIASRSKITAKKAKKALKH